MHGRGMGREWTVVPQTCWFLHCFIIFSEYPSFYYCAVIAYFLFCKRKPYTLTITTLNPLRIEAIRRVHSPHDRLALVISSCYHCSSKGHWIIALLRPSMASLKFTVRWAWELSTALWDSDYFPIFIKS